jgi:hypothetical protein
VRLGGQWRLIVRRELLFMKESCVAMFFFVVVESIVVVRLRGIHEKKRILFFAQVC